MSPLLCFSDEQLAVIRAAAEPLPIEQRAEFLQAVAFELKAQGPMVGNALVHQTCATLQRRFASRGTRRLQP